MNSVLRAVVIVCALVGLSWGAGDMTLTLEDGTTIFLYEDSTWGYGKGLHADQEKDLELAVGSGKFILIKTDFTWRYTNGKALVTRVFSTVTESGTSKHQHYNNAVTQAEKTLKTRTLARVRAVVKPKGGDDLLWNCIMSSGASLDKSESFGQLWSVSRKITLDESALRYVEECMKNPPAATGADSTAAQ